MDDDLTEEDISRRYRAAMGSVTMLNAVAADPDEDMTPFHNAIAANT